MAERCKAKSKRTGKRCKRWATPGYEVCRFHGANPNNHGGAPKGSKNHLKHGAYESLYLDQLPEEEKALYEQTTAETELDQEIRLCRLKLARLLKKEQMTVRNMFGQELTVNVTDEDRDKGIYILTERIRKLVETKAKLQATKPPGEDQAISEFQKAISGAGDVWDDEV